MTDIIDDSRDVLVRGGRISLEGRLGVFQYEKMVNLGSTYPTQDAIVTTRMTLHF